MYDQYGPGKDWMSVAVAAAAKLQTAFDAMTDGEVTTVKLKLSVHNKYYDDSEDITDVQTILDNGSEFGTGACMLNVNYDRVEVRALELLKDGQIAISWYKSGVFCPIAETVFYINNTASQFRHNAVLDDVEIVDDVGDVWTLDYWYSTWTDRQQEQDITDAEAEEIEN